MSFIEAAICNVIHMLKQIWVIMLLLLMNMHELMSIKKKCPKWPLKENQNKWNTWLEQNFVNEWEGKREKGNEFCLSLLVKGNK